MDRIYLSGSEEVARAGHNMVSAADAFSRSVQYLEEILSRHAQAMSEHADRIEQALKEAGE